MYECKVVAVIPARMEASRFPGKPLLQRYSKLSPKPLEISESVDFLRILEHNYRILGVICQEDTMGADRPYGIQKVEEILRKDRHQKEIYSRILIK